MKIYFLFLDFSLNLKYNGYRKEEEAMEEKERKIMDIIVYSEGKIADFIFYNLDGSIKYEYKGVLLK